MNVIDRYIGRAMLYSTLLVFAVLIGLFTFFEFIDKLDDVGRAAFGMWDVLSYLVLTLPKKAYELFPMAALLGTTMALSTLAVDSELIALRAAGVSLLRIVVAVAKTGLLFVLLAILIGEGIAPASEQLAQRNRAEAMRVGIQQDNNSIWLREGDNFVNIGEVLPDFSILRVNIYQFDQYNQLRNQVYAERAVYEGGRWRLQQVRQSQIAPDRIGVRNEAEQQWLSGVDPDVLGVFAVKPEGLSAWSLFRYIRHLSRNHQDTARYELALWYKLIAPLSTGVMVILAIPFVFTHPRSTGMGFRLFVGIMIGLAFFVLNRGFGFYSLLYGIPPLLGAILPTLAFFLLALFLLRRVA